MDPETPRRIQLRRTKGWRKPERCLTVARPSLYGNPFKIHDAIEEGFATEETAPAFVVACYRDWLTRGRESSWWFEAGKDDHAAVTEHLAMLRGYDLACWCPLDQPCHADVLLELANGGR